MTGLWACVRVGGGSLSCQGSRARVVIVVVAADDPAIDPARARRAGSIATRKTAPRDWGDSTPTVGAEFSYFSLPASQASVCRLEGEEKKREKKRQNEIGGEGGWRQRRRAGRAGARTSMVAAIFLRASETSADVARRQGRARGALEPVRLSSSLE